ncbi:MAG: hypothetical protein MUC65_06545 [Pontiellaceae bacterium]|nr:hypothetical protein [Pontiellaceae bacterium]
MPCGELTASDEVTVTVQDTTPPAINGASAKPAILSPPTGKMTTVTINYTAIDNNGSATCHLGPVTCNEAITSADWRILDTHRVQLTATRKGNGSGRIYTIPITCLDPSGNSARRTVTVIVPRGLGK